MKAKLIFSVLVILFTSKIYAQTYKIDSGHSSVQVQVGRFGVVAVSGRFKDVVGTIDYNSEDASQTKVEAVIKVDSYDANNKGGESAVKDIFLEASKYPEISFSGTSVIGKNSKNYLKGNLTIHGVTNEIMLPFTINGPLLDLPTRKQSIAFNASIIINRQDYGIEFDRKLSNGISLVSNDVKITLMILAIVE